MGGGLPDAQTSPLPGTHLLADRSCSGSGAELVLKVKTHQRSGQKGNFLAVIPDGKEICWFLFIINSF